MLEQKKPNLGLKALIIAGLMVFLLIPTILINDLVKEREARQDEAFKEVSSKWAETQTLAGPFVTIPLCRIHKGFDRCGEKVQTIHSYPSRPTEY